MYKNGISLRFSFRHRKKICITIDTGEIIFLAQLKNDSVYTCDICIPRGGGGLLNRGKLLSCVFFLFNRLNQIVKLSIETFKTHFVCCSISINCDNNIAEFRNVKNFKFSNLFVTGLIIPPGIDKHSVFLIKVRKTTKIRHRYNQVPHLPHHTSFVHTRYN